MRATPRLLSPLLVVVLVLGAAVPARAGDDHAEKLSVFAAASLTESFRAIGDAFEKADQGKTTVELNLAGSQALARQIVEGARADVFAAADEASMEGLRADHHLDGAPMIFARNVLAIAVPAGNPRKITGLADLAAPKLIVALCAPAVPAGRYAREAFRKAGVAVPESSQELDVRSALNKVELGEADAAVVYATDVRARTGHVDSVPIPDAQNVDARYPIAAVAGAPHPQAARRFIEYVRSPAGQRILADYSFRMP